VATVTPAEPPRADAPDAPATAIDEVAPAPSIATVLTTPGVAATLSCSMLARFPLGAIALLLLLRVTSGGANYAEAGAVGGCFGIALGVGQPLLSRMVDRRGQQVVLVVAGAVSGVLFAILAALPASTPLGVWFVFAALAGAAQPPVSGVMRALWNVLLPADEARHIGYAVDAIAFELVFSLAPLVVVGVIATLAGAQVALLTGAVLVAAASIALARTRASRTWRPTPRTGRRHPLDALKSPGVRTMLVVSLGLGGCFGQIEIGLAAYGREHGNTALIGALLCVWSVGSVVGGLVLARRPPARDPVRRIMWLMVALTVWNAALGFVASPLLLGATLAIAGAWVAPIYSTENGLLGQLAVPGALTETFGWTITATTVGMTTASPIAGHLIDAFSPATAMGASAIPVGVAAIVVVARRGTLRVPAS
jgi:MFS family permease